MLPLDGAKDGYLFLSKPMPNKVNGIAVPKRLLLYMQHLRCLWAYYQPSAMIYLFLFCLAFTSKCIFTILKSYLVTRYYTYLLLILQNIHVYYKQDYIKRAKYLLRFQMLEFLSTFYAYNIKTIKYLVKREKVNNIANYVLMVFCYRNCSDLL